MNAESSSCSPDFGAIVQLRSKTFKQMLIISFTASSVPEGEDLRRKPCTLFRIKIGAGPGLLK
jgi:hypothetical protein